MCNAIILDTTGAGGNDVQTERRTLGPGAAAAAALIQRAVAVGSTRAAEGAPLWEKATVVTARAT